MYTALNGTTASTGLKSIVKLNQNKCIPFILMFFYAKPNDINTMDMNVKIKILDISNSLEWLCCRYSDSG